MTPVVVDGTRERPLDFTVPALSLRGDVPGERLLARRQLLKAIDDAQRLAEEAPAGPRLQQTAAQGFLLAGFPANQGGL